MTRLAGSLIASASPGFTIELGRKRIRFLFGYPHDVEFVRRNILPWAAADYRVVEDDTRPDFWVGLYLGEDGFGIPEEFISARGTKFLLAGEKETRFPRIENCYSFVQEPRAGDDPKTVRYAPTLCIWTPPLPPRPKAQKLSVVDSGKYAWRIEMIKQVAGKAAGLHAFGGAAGVPLGGYHGLPASGPFGNDKYKAIESHAFYLSIERARAMDYITEKLNDAILCNAVPLYWGAPNIQDYYLREALIPYDEIDKIDWSNWPAEYAKRERYVQAQKAILRSKFNVISYFNAITDDLSLLDKLRPITLSGT